VLDRLQSHGSCHPRKATAFRQDSEFFLFPVDSIPAWVTCSLRSTGITPFRHYYGAVRAWSAHRYIQPRGASACAFSLNITEPVLKFRPKAPIRVMPAEHRTPHGQYVGICHAAPRARGKLRFWCRHSSFRCFIRGSFALISLAKFPVTAFERSRPAATFKQRLWTSEDPPRKPAGQME
jgi:hypothetical protein